MLTRRVTQEYHVWTHDQSGDAVVRTTAYSLPEHLHDHVELVQPTTMFTRTKALRTTFRFDEGEATFKAASSADTPPISVPSASGGHVDASCNKTITITCIQQLYNAVGFAPDVKHGNEIGITGYLEQFANIADLQTFYADQRPDALNSSFTTVLINGACAPTPPRPTPATRRPRAPCAGKGLRSAGASARSDVRSDPQAA